MQIIQAANPVLGVGLHYFYILKNDAGQIVAQMNGLQFKDGVPSTTGVGGNLQFTTAYQVEINSNTQQVVVAIGDKSLIQDKMWAAGIQCGVEINKLNYDYMALDTFGGHNSNALFSTLATCMSLDPIAFNGLSPGLNDEILDVETIRVIKAQNGLGGTASSGGSSGGGGSSGSGGPYEGGGGGIPDITPPKEPKGGGYWNVPDGINSADSDSLVMAQKSINEDRVHGIYDVDVGENVMPVVIAGIPEHSILM